VRRAPTGERAPIAIVGMAGRFPGAGSVDALWRMLRDGLDGVEVFAEGTLEGVGRRGRRPTRRTCARAACWPAPTASTRRSSA
jgi:acyl transferase domain-containing protein